MNNEIVSVEVDTGKCPNCGKYELNYEPFEMDGEYGNYPFVCENCGLQGNESYELKYIGTDYNKNQDMVKE